MWRKKTCNKKEFSLPGDRLRMAGIRGFPEFGIDSQYLAKKWRMRKGSVAAKTKFDEGII
jgi:hypothetical protein